MFYIERKMRAVSAILRSFPSVMQALKFKWLLKSIKVLSYLLAMLKSPGKSVRRELLFLFWGMFLLIWNFANLPNCNDLYSGTYHRIDRKFV